MKLWLLKGWCPDEKSLEEGVVSIYGVFSSEELCNEHKERLARNIKEHGETEQLFVMDLELDTPTNTYISMIEEP